MTEYDLDKPHLWHSVQKITKSLSLTFYISPVFTGGKNNQIELIFFTLEKPKVNLKAKIHSTDS